MTAGTLSWASSSQGCRTLMGPSREQWLWGSVPSSNSGLQLISCVNLTGNLGVKPQFPESLGTQLLSEIDSLKRG